MNSARLAVLAGSCAMALAGCASMIPQLAGKGPLLDDQSLVVLSLLSELVYSAKISSDIPGTQQLQVLP